MSTAQVVWLIVFCLSFGLAFYAFLGYPAVLWAYLKISRTAFKPRKFHNSEGETHSPAGVQKNVTVVVAAYNERDGIAATLKTLLQQDFPTDHIKIIVFSDGSTDGTDQIVQQFAQHGVELIRFEGRVGKTECQNRVVERLINEPKNKERQASDIVVFSDGNILWRSDAVRKLVEPFADSNVASTTGALRLIRSPSPNRMSDSPAGQQKKSEEREEHANEGMFRQLDHIIKQGESSLLSSVGVNGPIYAVRLADYIRLQPHMVSDLVLPVLQAAQGKHVQYVPDAVGLEPATPTIWHEFKRKRRLVTQGFVAMPLMFRAATPLRRPKLFWLVLSHKVLRWVGVELLAIAFVATVALAILGLPSFTVIFLAELVLLLAAGVGMLFADGLSRNPAFSALSFFVLTNLASLVAVFDVIRGETATRWRTQRT